MRTIRGLHAAQTAILLSTLVLTVGWARAGSLVKQAPPKTSTLSNPLEGRERAQRAGAKLFGRECASCHGPNGEGGITKAPPLNRPEVFEAAPGVLFWVLRNGSLLQGMPTFAHLPDAQRWQIVTYLQTFRPH
jgi:mono/diheme cytochrome c family protein